MADYLLAIQSIPTAFDDECTASLSSSKEGRHVESHAYNATHVCHHHGDELMLMNVHGDSSKLINAS